MSNYLHGWSYLPPNKTFSDHFIVMVEVLDVFTVQVPEAENLSLIRSSRQPELTLSNTTQQLNSPRQSCLTPWNRRKGSSTESSNPFLNPPHRKTQPNLRNQQQYRRAQAPNKTVHLPTSP